MDSTEQTFPHLNLTSTIPLDNDDFSSQHPQAYFTDLPNLQDGPLDPFASQIGPPPLLLPPNPEELQNLPPSQVHQLPLQPIQLLPQVIHQPPENPSYVPVTNSQLPRPVRIAPRRELLQSNSPYIPHNSSQSQPVTPSSHNFSTGPTPYASPMSLGTPLTTYTTPQTTPIHYASITPVPPVSDHVAAFSTTVGPLLDDRVEDLYRKTINRALGEACTRKLELREALKQTARPTISRSRASSRREAKVTRLRDEEYKCALEREVKTLIHKVCVLAEFIEMHLPDKAELARRKAGIP